MITPTQMRAARAMLDVSQGHVAEYLGIAANTLSKIESGQSDVSVSRNTDIQRFYERESIEFTDNDGVQWSKSQIITYEGREGVRAFFDDVYNNLKEGGEISLFNGSPDLLVEWLGKDFYSMHAERMKNIKSNLDVKIIVKETEVNLIAGEFAEYRGFPEGYFNNKTIYVYSNKVGFFSFSDGDVIIRVFENSELADSMRVLFDIAWNNVARVLM